MTGSIGIRSDAIHSAIDLSGVIIGFIGIRVASRSPDERHAFGHGKAEDIAGAVIAGLIFAVAGIVGYQAGQRLFAGEAIRLVTTGIYITAAAIVINVIVARYATQVAQANDSIALEATARDMMADVYSSVAVLTGLALVRLTALEMADPIAALVVVGLIVRTAYLVLRKSLTKLMDTRLPEAEEQVIRCCLTDLENCGRIAGFHNLRTRKAGNQRHIDLHLVMPRHTSVDESHDICDRLEQDIERRLHRTSVTIHIEPCDGNCESCSASCKL